jgi:hypothetical protein
MDGVAYGNAEIDEKSGVLTVGTTVFNHSNKTVVVEMRCIADQKEQTEQLLITPFQSMDIAFKYQVVRKDHAVELYADDQMLIKKL